MANDTSTEERYSFSAAQWQRLGTKLFAVSAWFKARGEKPPDVWMDFFSEMIIDDSPLTEAEIARTHELAAKHGWLRTDDGNQQPSGVREDPVAPRTLDAPHATESSSETSLLVPVLPGALRISEKLLGWAQQIEDYAGICSPIHEMRLEAERLAWAAGDLRATIKALPRYDEADVRQRPSTAEWIDAEQLDDIVAALDRGDPR